MEDLVPTEFYLGQNFPDPFKNKTIIKYCLPEETRIKLEIFDNKNQKVKTLVNEIKNEGTYQVEFYANGLQSNDYYYRMQAGNFKATKKMVLIK